MNEIKVPEELEKQYKSLNKQIKKEVAVVVVCYILFIVGLIFLQNF